jgi:hypothetical protein
MKVAILAVFSLLLLAALAGGHVNPDDGGQVNTSQTLVG